MAKDWIKKAAASVKRRGTKGKCGPSCSRPGCTGRALALCRAFHTIARRRKKRKQEGGTIDLPEKVDWKNLPYETDPLAYAKDLYSFYGKRPDEYEVNRQSYEVTPETFEKYPEFKYAENLPVKPSRYVTIKDKKNDFEFAYPAYTLEEIQSKSLGGILGDVGSFASIGSTFGPIGTAIGGGLGLVKGLFGHSKEKKLEEEEMQQIEEQKRIMGMKHLPTASNPYAPTFPYGGMMPYSLAELEKQEVMQSPTGAMAKVNGPSHAQGGVDVMARPGTRVYSDKLKFEGKTFAEHADEIAKKKAKAEKIASDTRRSDIDRGTAEKNLENYQKQLDRLFAKQESMKTGRADKVEMQEGGFLDKLGGGLLALGQLAPVAYNLYQGTRPVEKLDPKDYYNPYANQAMDLMANRRYNVDPQLRMNEAAYRTALQNIKNYAGGSRGAYLGNVNAAMMGQQMSNAQAWAQKQNVDLAMMGEQAKMGVGLGTEKAQTRLLVKDINTQNEAARRAFLGTAAGQLGSFFQTQQQNRNLRQRDEMMMPYMQQYLSMLSGGYGGANTLPSVATPQLNWDPSMLGINPYLNS